MRIFYCLSERAINVLKQKGMKLEVMLQLGINDTRTVSKHIKNNFPDGPLMNFNIRELIRRRAPYLSEEEIYHELTPTELERVQQRREQLTTQNAKYNNENGEKNGKKSGTTQTTSKDSSNSINHSKTL